MSRHNHEQGAPLGADCDNWCQAKYGRYVKNLKEQLQEKEQELVEAERQLKVFDEMTDHDEQWIEKYVKEIEQQAERIKVLEETLRKSKRNILYRGN